MNQSFKSDIMNSWIFNKLIDFVNKRRWLIIYKFF